MKIRYYGAAAIFAVAVLGFNFAGKTLVPETSQTPSAEFIIIMKDDKYEPQNPEIKKGTKVIFKNTSTEPRWPASNIHPTHGIYPEFDPREPVPSGSEWSFVFEKAGRWKYHDHLVPLIRGEITVIP